MTNVKRDCDLLEEWPTAEGAVVLAEAVGTCRVTFTSNDGSIRIVNVTVSSKP